MLDWSEHREECEDLMIQRKLNERAVKKLAKDLAKAVNHEIQSYKKFIRNISLLIYTQNAKKTKSIKIAIKNDPQIKCYFSTKCYMDLLNRRSK